MSSSNNHHHDGGLSSSQACEPDQAFFTRGTYTASDNAPARKSGLATQDYVLKCEKFSNHFFMSILLLATNVPNDINISLATFISK